MNLAIGGHWLDVFESGVAGDMTLDAKVILHRDLNDGAPWAYLARYFGPIPPFECAEETRRAREFAEGRT